MTPPMKERPIIFTPESVRAILEGRKTQTRRAMKPQPLVEKIDDGWRINERCCFMGWAADHINRDERFVCPYGKAGDRLWVREPWCCYGAGDAFIGYRATDEERISEDARGPWRSPLHLPRKWSRLLLEVVSVRAQRVQDIGEAEARAEGVPPNWIDDLTGFNPDEHGFLPPDYDPEDYEFCTARDAFALWWDRINGKRKGGAFTWERNPWVFVIEFAVVGAKGGKDA